VTDWTFADPNYRPTTLGNTLTVGAIDSSNYTTATKAQLLPVSTSNLVYTFSSFGFGQYNKVQNSEYYAYINNVI